MTLHASIPNTVLDLWTLRVVHAGVVLSKGLIRGRMHAKRWLGLVTVHCAVGTVCSAKSTIHDAFSRWVNEHDLDIETLREIICVNDGFYEEDGSEADRREYVLDWLDRCIAYNENVHKELTALASSSVANIYTQLDADKAEAQEPREVCDAEPREPVAA